MTEENYTFLVNGRSMWIDGKLRQIGSDNTIFCPKCHEPILYWQIPFSVCYADKPAKLTRYLE